MAEQKLWMVTDERASRRFHQMAVIERELQGVIASIAQCKEHLKELREGRDGLVERLRAAARDEGELPLFDNLDDVDDERKTDVSESEGAAQGEAADA